MTNPSAWAKVGRSRARSLPMLEVRARTVAKLVQFESNVKDAEFR
jgi:hypothetical protein